MDSPLAELLIRWSVRAAVACYGVRIVVELLARGRGVDHRYAHSDRCARWSWTLGLACYLVHVVSAFHFRHAWSHQAALKHTALQTQEVVGWAWSGDCS